MATESGQVVSFGKKGWHGPAGFAGGAVLLGLAVWLFVTTRFAAGGAPRGVAWLGILGLFLLGNSFRVRGVRITPEGLVVWDYCFWIVGRSRLVRPEDIQSVVLGGKDGKFTVCARLRDGRDCPVPATWAALKDAQAVVDLCTTLYGSSAGVEISDGKLLEEAATFAAAQRWSVRPTKALRGDGERLVFNADDGEPMGEAAVWRRTFGRSRAEIADGPGDLPSNGARWTLSDRFFSSRLSVVENSVSCEEVRTEVNWTGKCLYYWIDPSGVYWSAVLSSDSNARTPFTLRFYRGLAEKVGSKGEQTAAMAKQGEAVLVAVADGPADCFHVDVADAAAWPWVRIALATMWLKHRPTFRAAK